MNVFISWSGSESKKIAEELKLWIPKVLQSVKPYFTPSDIEKGAKWESEITKKLNESNIGIICLTYSNIEKPWILFEAGALSNKLEKSKVCPLLFGVSNADLTGPLSTFQTTDFNKSEFKKLMITINKSLGESKIGDELFNEVFETFYPKLEENINQILTKPDSETSNIEGETARTDRDLLEEILELTRRQYSRPQYKKRTSYKDLSKHDIEFVENEIQSYIDRHDIDVQEITDEEMDEIFSALKESQAIRDATGKASNFRRMIRDYFK